MENASDTSFGPQNYQAHHSVILCGRVIKYIDRTGRESFLKPLPEDLVPTCFFCSIECRIGPLDCWFQRILIGKSQRNPQRNGVGQIAILRCVSANCLEKHRWHQPWMCGERGLRYARKISLQNENWSRLQINSKHCASR